MKRITFLSTLAVLFILNGCDLSTRNSTPQVQPSDLAQVGSIRYSVPPDRPRTREEMQASLEAGIEATKAISNSINRLDATEWEEADRRFQTALAGLDGIALERARQLAGAAMIRVWLPNAPDTPEARAIAARYVSYLVDTQSPEAGIVLDGLARVGDHWDAETKASAARAAADAAQPTILREREREAARQRTNTTFAAPETVGERAALSDLEQAQAELRALADNV